MIKKDGCPYCHSEGIEKFGRLAFETELSMIIAFKDQSHRGRMIVAYKKDHVAELGDLSREERIKFMDDVIACANAIKAVYNPDRINYGTFSDSLGHLHVHLVPKYKDEFEWNVPFQMNTGAVAADSELNELIENIKKNFTYQK